MLVEEASYRESIEIESEKHCHVRIALLRVEEPVSGQAASRVWKVKALLQGAEGTKVLVNCRLQRYDLSSLTPFTQIVGDTTIAARVASEAPLPQRLDTLRER